MSEESSLAEWLSTLKVENLENDPYPIFTRLRKDAPMAYIPAIGSWVATTWELCNQVANDAANFVGGTSPAHDRVDGPDHILVAEGELHRRLRDTIDPPLRPRAFASSLEETVRPVARERLDAIKGKGHAELLAEYFELISVRCVGDILGFTNVPDETLRRWFHALSSGFANGAALNPDGSFANPDGFKETDQAHCEIREAVLALAAADESGSMVSNWMHSGMPDGETRPLDGFFSSLHVTILGGFQEPGHLCGNTFLGLSTRPDQFERVKSDLSLLPRAITESMRWLAPIFSAASRRTSKTVTIGGATVEQGQTVWLAYGSANRDESVFDRPEIYDLDRPPHAHLAFGKGRHACSGAAFAPQVARIAFEELLGELPTITLDPAMPVREWGWLFRGAKELHAVW